MQTVKFSCGQFGETNAETTTSWNPDTESRHELMQRALRWCGGWWEDTGKRYPGVVRICGVDGEEIARENVMIAADGELDFDV
jgi:hypothetical protein